MNQPNTKGLTQAFFSFLLCGGLLAFPGVVLDLLLNLWNWTPVHFGWGLFVQALFALCGTRACSRLSSRSVSHAGSLNLFCIAHLFLALGAGLLYFSWQFVHGHLLDAAILLGFACTGLAVGSATLLNNNLAFAARHVPRTLNVLNLAYTVGAVLIPALAATLVQTSLLASWATGVIQSWQLIALVLAVLSIALACLHQKQRVHLCSFELPTQDKQLFSAECQRRPKHILRGSEYGLQPLLCAAVVMACYVGSEINLSNLWVPFLQNSLPEENAAAFNFRLASPLYWAGLFLSRLFFSLRAPLARSLTFYIAFFGISSTLAIAASLGFTLVDGQAFVLVKDSNFLFMLLLLCSFLSGLFIGSTYSFVLGALTNHYKAGRESQRASALVIQWGVLGAMSLPPAIGFVTNRLGTQSAMGFVLITQSVFTCAALLWLRVKPVHPVSNHSDACKGDQCSAQQKQTECRN